MSEYAETKTHLMVALSALRKAERELPRSTPRALRLRVTVSAQQVAEAIKDLVVTAR